jgi:hypothetical protein
MRSVGPVRQHVPNQYNGLHSVFLKLGLQRPDSLAVQTPRFLVSIEEAHKSDKIYVKRSRLHRWGVFAREAIKKHEVLEDSPYFSIEKEEVDNAGSVEPYVYWLEDCTMLIGMGYAGLYNHNFEPNADYQVDKINEVIRHYAIRDIGPGEEITINYGVDNATFAVNK